MLEGKIGVLLVNLGTPDEPTTTAVARYLKEFLLDPRVIDVNTILRNFLVRCVIVPKRKHASTASYKKLWLKEGSPLKVYGYILKDAVQKSLGNDYVVELAMRYQNPSIEEAIKLVEAKSPIKEWIILPLFPQYASATTGSIHELVMSIFAKRQTIPSIKFINSYYDHPMMIQAFVERAKQYNLKDYDHVLFSYHGLPERQLLKADTSCNHCLKVENCCENISTKNQYCYSAQCYATTKAIAEALQLNKDEYGICYQSRLGREEWLKPYTSEVLKSLVAQGKKNILVFSPAFIADCIETTIEISEEYAEEFENMGGEHLQLVEGLNDHPLWIKTVVDIIQKQNVYVSI